MCKEAKIFKKVLKKIGGFKATNDRFFHIEDNILNLNVISQKNL